MTEPVSNPPGIAVLTRPAGQSAGLADALRQRGWQVHDWPALQLAVLPGTAVPDPADFDLVMFVSGNAVRFYFQQQAADTGTAPAWPPGVPAATVGLGSAGALRQCVGSNVCIIHPPADSPTFDSEALWAELARRGVHPRRVLIVRGGRGGAQGDGRSWLANQFVAAGAQVTLYAAYRREPAVWPVSHLEQLQTWQELALHPTWLLSSREAMDSVVQQLGLPTAIRHWQGCRMVVPHPRIAAALTQLAKSCGTATTPVEPGVAGPDPGVIMIQTCLPHDDAVLNAIVN